MRISDWSSVGALPIYYANDLEVQALGCMCIQHLARNGASSLALGKVGACARVVNAFKFVDELSVVLHQTVAALCMQPSNIVEFGHAGLCEVLVRLMDEKPGAIALQVRSDFPQCARAAARDIFCSNWFANSAANGCLARVCCFLWSSSLAVMKRIERSCSRPISAKP